MTMTMMMKTIREKCERQKAARHNQQKSSTEYSRIFVVTTKATKEKKNVSKAVPKGVVFFVLLLLKYITLVGIDLQKHTYVHQY